MDTEERGLRKWDTRVMSTGTMAIFLCPLSNTWNEACAKWNDEAAQAVALPSPRVQTLLVTQCRRRLSSNFKAGKWPTWEHLQLGSFGQIKQKCQGLKSPLLKCNSVKEFAGWNSKWKKINNIWVPREDQGILSKGRRKRSSSAFTLTLQLLRFAHWTWMLQRRQKSLAQQAIIYINLISQELTLRKCCHIYFLSMFTVETALSIPR